MKKSINLMMGSAMVASSVALMSCTPTNAVNSAINNAANKVNQAAQVSNAVSNAKIETVTLALSGLT